MHTLSICYIHFLTCSQSHWLIENFCSHNQKEVISLVINKQAAWEKRRKKKQEHERGVDLVWSSRRVASSDGPSCCWSHLYLQMNVPSSPSPSCTQQPQVGQDPLAYSPRSCHLIVSTSAKDRDLFQSRTPPRTHRWTRVRSSRQHQAAILGGMLNAALALIQHGHLFLLIMPLVFFSWV